MSRTGSTRWWRWPTAARCSATAGLRRWPPRQVRGRRSGAGHDRTRRGRCQRGAAAGAGARSAARRPAPSSLRAREVAGSSWPAWQRTGCCGGCSASSLRESAGGFADPQPADAIRAGIGMVPGERRLGLVMKLSVRDNILLPSLDRLTRAGHLDRGAGDRLVGRADGGA